MELKKCFHFNYGMLKNASILLYISAISGSIGKNMREHKKGKGRPKGSKSGLPFTTFPDAIKHAQNIWDKAQDNEISFKEISNFLGFKKQKSVRVLNQLQDFYGIVEKLDKNRWRLTDVGKKVVKNDYTSLKEVFSKDSMFRELLNEFLGKAVTEGVILDHITNNYKYTDPEEVRRRLLGGIKIIQSSTPSKPEIIENESKNFVLPLIQLRYALKPPSEKETDALINNVVDVLSKSNNDALKLIAELMIEKKKDKTEITNLLERAMKQLNLYVVGEELTPRKKKDKSDNLQKGDSTEEV